jgi:glucan-binding YG repeat protein
MKAIGIISTAALFLLLGLAAPGYAGQEKQGEPEKQAKPEQQHAQQQKQAKPEQQHVQQQKQAKPEQQQQHAQQQKQQDQNKQQQQHAQQQKQQDQNKQQQQHAQQQKRQDQNKQQQQHAQQQKRQDQNKQQQQHAQQQKQQDQRAGVRGGGRIPEDRYRANFGREHTFHVSQADYRGHRFHYGGYWFGFVDPWPSNWLYTQNVYVVDINGVYYLCNPMYPGVNIALSFTL